MSIIDSVKNEYNNLTEFQLSLYNDDANSSDDLVAMSTAPSVSMEKMAWDSNFSEIMKSTKVTDNNGKSYINYKLNKNADKLRRVRMIIRIPTIEVKEEYQKNTLICLPAYPGYAIVENAILSNKEGDKIIDELDTNRYIQNLNYFEHGRKNILKNIGHIPELIEWKTCIPERDLYVEQPWFYLRKGLPLVLTSDYVHKYDFRNQLGDILKMKIYNEKDESWEYIKPDLDRITCRDNGVPCKSKKIEIPKLRAYYSILTEAEKNEIKREGKQDIFYSTVKHNKYTVESKIYNLNLQYDYASYCKMWCIRDMARIAVNDYTSYIELPKSDDKIIVKYDKDIRVEISASELLADADSYFPRQPIVDNQYYYHFGRDYSKKYIQTSTNTEKNKISISFTAPTSLATGNVQVDEYLYFHKQLKIEDGNFTIISK